LKETIPRKVKNTSSYNLRNGDNYNSKMQTWHIWKIIRRRLNIEVEFSEYRITTSYFNKEFRKTVSSENINNPKPPKYFSYGPRLLNIIHTKLRHTCILSYGLYRRNIVNSPLCSCGMREDAYHFFFEFQI
jgi:hypothetical protein